MFIQIKLCHKLGCRKFQHIFNDHLFSNKKPFLNIESAATIQQWFATSIFLLVDFNLKNYMSEKTLDIIKFC